MKLIYSGKTKDVYEQADGNILLQFKDDVTGADGKFDPGANQVGLAIDGMGQRNVQMTTYFFELLQSEGFPTHFIAGDPGAATLTVKPAEAFGHGLEVITRYRAVGSFFRRYGEYVEEGAPLAPYTEFTLKDDERQDPLITREGLLVLEILTAEQYDILMTLNRQITDRIRSELAHQNLELYDIKLEYGLSRDTQEIMLIDEISGGNMRVYAGTESIEPLALADYFYPNH